MNNTTSEQWKFIEYGNIKINTYQISTYGNIRNYNTMKTLKCLNPKNERGYVRVTLQHSDGTYKKYALHRLVIATFLSVCDDEVNHIDGNKLNNALYNLEYVSRKENAVHAANNGLYSSCENHYKAVLTNSQVKEICMLMESGKSDSEISNIMNFDYNRYSHILNSIRHKRSWTNVSNNFNVTVPANRKYDLDDIKDMCKMIYIDNISINNILDKFPKYNRSKLRNVLKKIKQRKLYKKIIDQVVTSTTREKLLSYIR